MFGAQDALERERRRWDSAEARARGEHWLHIQEARQQNSLSLFPTPDPPPPAWDLCLCCFRRGMERRRALGWGEAPLLRGLALSCLCTANAAFLCATEPEMRDRTWVPVVFAGDGLLLALRVVLVELPRDGMLHYLVVVLANVCCNAAFLPMAIARVSFVTLLTSVLVLSQLFFVVVNVATCIHFACYLFWMYMDAGSFHTANPETSLERNRRPGAIIFSVRELARAHTAALAAGSSTYEDQGGVLGARRLEQHFLSPAVETFIFGQERVVVTSKDSSEPPSPDRPGDAEAPATAEEGTDAAGAEETVTCAICLSDIEVGAAAGRLSCGHTFHLGCIRHWLGMLQAPSKSLCRSCPYRCGPLVCVPPKQAWENAPDQAAGDVEANLTASDVARAATVESAMNVSATS